MGLIARDIAPVTPSALSLLSNSIVLIAPTLHRLFHREGTPLPLEEPGAHLGYQAIMEWDGYERDIPVYQLASGPSIGMAILKGHRFSMDVLDDGALTIEPGRLCTPRVPSPGTRRQANPFCPSNGT